MRSKETGSARISINLECNVTDGAIGSDHHMNRKHLKYSRKFIVWTTLIALLLTVIIPMQGYAAAVPKLDDIRVALFIDARGSVPTVTLSSAQGLQVGIRNPEGTSLWFETGANVQSRFTATPFSIQVLETDNYSTAVSTYARLASAGQAYVFAVSSRGNQLYQVRLGMFNSRDEALAARARVPQDIASLITLKGPLYIETGRFDSEDAARQHQQLLAQSGVITDVVLVDNGGKPSYAVWGGEAADQQSLDDWTASAMRAVPGIQAKSVDTKTAYLAKKVDITAQDNLQGIVHYIIGGQDTKVWAQPSQAGETKVTERSNRSYRGAMEISQYNGKLALINQLPFEQYLYGVVSTELSASWPLEALKAQAVAARTFALTLGMKYKIAHISDTTFDQAYNGKGVEFATAIQSVEETRGEVIVDANGLITPFYASNHGGLTADPSEVWGSSNATNYLKSVQSPDQDVQKGKLNWYRIEITTGQYGYIRSDYMQVSSQPNDVGFRVGTVLGNGVNVRSAPYVDNANAPIAQVNQGEQYTIVGEDIESSTFMWIRGPYSASTMLSTINSRAKQPITGPLKTLEVTSRGTSQRVIAMQANGQNINVSSPDSFRGAMNDVLSTRFDVEEMGRYTIIGANGATVEYPITTDSLYIMSASDQTPRSLDLPQFVVYNSDQNARIATLDPQFRFIGQGWGHGLGMSQYGAKSFAELGYTYQQILQYYYNGVSIVKG